VATRDDRRDAGQRRGERTVRRLADEWRELRIAAGLSQAALARSVGMSRAAYARLEQGRVSDVGVVRATTISAALGHDFAARLFPTGAPLRDAAHVRLLDRFDRVVSGAYQLQREAPMPIPGDRRAWDRVLIGPVAIGIEAETRPSDLQAVERAMALKQRDSGVQRSILLVAGTKRNRALIRQLLPGLRSTFPIGTAEALGALRAGRDPGGNCLVLL
jgi:transcriptional regulator with XRE-family HTH domain